MSATEYLSLVDEMAAAIAAGRLKPGDRLQPQRVFALEKGIAASTASRVYMELLRRGLVVGEVGRGTFVGGRTSSAGASRSEPRDGRIDLEFNFPTIPTQFGLIAKSLAGLQRVDAAAAALGPVTQGRLAAARSITAAFMTTPRWQPDREAFVFTGCGRQSIAAAISAVVPRGGRIAVEAVTYPMLKNFAAHLDVGIAPIPMDSEGVCPEAVAKAHKTGALSAIYVQPVLQNPLGHSMSAARREELLRLAARLNLYVIEDLVYGFLSDDPPLAAKAPDRCIVADSLSKRLAPGVAVGFLHAPKAVRERVAAAVRAGAWSVAPLALDAGTRLMADGTATEIGRQKRADAGRRQEIVASCLKGFEVIADRRSYHAWLKLPEGWRAETFAAAAARAGIALTPASAFAMAPGHAPNAVRLALGLATEEDLTSALARLAGLLARRPEDDDTTE